MAFYGPPLLRPETTYDDLRASNLNSSNEWGYGGYGYGNGSAGSYDNDYYGGTNSIHPPPLLLLYYFLLLHILHYTHQ